MTFAVFTSMVALSMGAFELEWRAEETCAPRPDVEALVGARQGRAEVQIRRVQETWEVTVLFFEPFEALRRVRTSSCEEAARVAGLLVKLGSRGAFPSVEAVALPPPPPPPVEEPQPIVKPAAPSPPAARVSLHAGAAVDIGTLPLVDSRLALSAQLSLGLLRLALDGRFGFPQAARGVSFSRLFEGQVAACLDFTWRSLSAGPCVSVAAGSWTVSRADGPRGEALLVSTGPQGRLAVRIVGGLEVGAVAGLRVNFRRPEPFTESGVLFTTPLLAGDFQLTAGWRW